MVVEAETSTVPVAEVLRFIVQNSVQIQSDEGSGKTPLVELTLRRCDSWNKKVAVNLIQEFPGIRVALITDGKARENRTNDSTAHTLGIGLYADQLFAYDASIAQQEGIHQKRPVRIWRGDCKGLKTLVTETFGGSWNVMDKAVDFLKGTSTFPNEQIVNFHNLPDLLDTLGF